MPGGYGLAADYCLLVPPPPRPLTSRERRLLWLSHLLFILTAVVAALYVAIFLDPGLVPVPLRPLTPTPTAPRVPEILAPPGSTSALATPTSMPTATVPRTALPLTPTRPRPRPSLTPIEALPTSTPAPTFTPTITPTPTPTDTSTPTPTWTQSRYRFTVQPGYPAYSAYPGGCNWMGFAGQVFDLEGKPIIDLVIHIGGVDHLVLSGSSQVFNIKGWVAKVADRPAASRGFYTVQVQDTVGNPLSEAIPLDTFNDCQRNLVTLNFVQNH